MMRITKRAAVELLRAARDQSLPADDLRVLIQFVVACGRPEVVVWVGGGRRHPNDDGKRAYEFIDRPWSETDASVERLIARGYISKLYSTGKGKPSRISIPVSERSPVGTSPKAVRL
jgi:hypothetical protein